MLNFGLNENPFTLSAEKDEAILRQLCLLQVSTEKAYPGEMTFDAIHDWYKRFRVDYLFFNALLKKHGNVKFDIPEESLDKFAKSCLKYKAKDVDEEKYISRIKNGIKSITLWGIVQQLREVLKKDNIKRGVKELRRDKWNQNAIHWEMFRNLFATIIVFKHAISQGKVKFIKLEDQYDLGTYPIIK